MDNEINENIYAQNLNNDIVFVGDVESGRKGYFCLGCNGEMQAVKPKKNNIRSYFRHDVNYSPGEKLCTYRDETYRHKLAKEILQTERRIKVPALYKYPPKGVEGSPNLISQSTYIKAFSVSIEMTFYEDANGEIKYGKNIAENKVKHLLIKPDVTFFDSQNKPILFIELTATHKVDEEKKIKFKRLGIDAIEVTIPKDSPKEIRRTFHITDRTKWIYSYENEKREYLHIPTSFTKGIQPTDKIQREFFEESFKCRSAQIRNLIYAIGICLESEQFTSIKRNLESEISRVEENTKDAQNEWERICQKRIEEIGKQLGGEKDRLRNIEESIKTEEIEIERKTDDLEKRYLTKREELEINVGQLQSEDFEFERARTETEESIRTTELRITEIIDKRKNIEGESADLKNARGRIIEQFKEAERNEYLRYRSDESRITQRIEEERGLNEHSQGRFENDRTESKGILEQEERRVIDELSSRYRQCIRELENEEFIDSGIERAVSKKIDDYNEAISILNDIATIYRDKERVRIAYEAVRSNAYKNWTKT